MVRLNSYEPLVGGDRASGTRQSLLVVDDDPGVREALRTVFQSEYDVLLASSGFEALAMVADAAIDAAILDIRMAGMSGIELLERLKADDPDLEVIMLTGYETLETARQALRLGACDYLDKPCRVPTLKRSVANAMRRRQDSRQVEILQDRLTTLQEDIENQKLREEISQTRAQIYASIIHDINSPLAVIAGFVEVISERVHGAKQIAGEDLVILEDRLGRISRQISNCVEICRRYVGMLRDQGSQVAPIFVNQLLADVEELSRTHPGSNGHDLRIGRLREDASVCANVTDLVQILLNLIVNGLQSTFEPHRVDLTVDLQSELPFDPEAKPAPGEFFFMSARFQRNPPFVVFSIFDDGPGIPQDVFPRIFVPYFSTKPLGKGSGLGLSIVRRLAEQSGSVVFVVSHPPDGTRFSLIVPAGQRKS